jgi:Secretion system C-terminal sorting domain
MKQTLSPTLILLFLTNAPSASSLASIPCTIQSKQNFVSLTVESTGWSAELFWNATFDKDLVAFSVQRSHNGIEYEDIIRYDQYYVATGETQTFREQDLNPYPGDNFYRIRFMLADGQQVLSERCKVYFRDIAAFEIFPNPTGRQLNLLLKKFKGESIEVHIFDGIGCQVFKQYIPIVDDGIFQVELDVMNPGVYAVSVLHNGQTFTRRLIVTKAEG